MARSSANERVGRVERCRPINYFLAARNVVMVFCGSVVLAATLMAYEKIKADFLRMQVTVHAAPCAVATPSVRRILSGIGRDGFSQSPLLVPKTEQVASVKVAGAICESSNVYMAVSSVLENSSMKHFADTGVNPPSYIQAEADLLENLCERRDPERDIYGEIHRRIGTAYVLANPAFKRYHTTGCMESHDPFPTATPGCTYASSVVHAELFSAAQDAVIGGYGKLPPVGNMLYRLLALSVIAEHDRRLNGDLCFANKMVRNATELCQDIYDTSGANFSAYPPATSDVSTGGYAAVVHGVRSCGSIFAPPSAASPPPPPPFPNWNFVDPVAQGMGSVSPLVDACRNIHSFGHFDQESAFGIPDILTSFSWKPAHWDGPAGWFYYALSYDNMQGVGTMENNPINALKLHNAYRLAVSSAMVILIGVCCGYWIGFGGTPLVALFLFRYIGVQNNITGNYSTLLAPRLGYGATIVICVSLLVWLYSTLLDPWLPAARSYTTSASCSDWNKRNTGGSVFVTSDNLSGSWEFLVSYLFLLMPTHALLYGLFCRGWGVEAKEWKIQIALVERIPKLELFLILLQAGSILCFVVLATEDGDLWFDTTIGRHPESHYRAMPDTENMIEDLSGAITVAVLGGVSCSITRQRWTISTMGARVHIFWFICIICALVFPLLVYRTPFYTFDLIFSGQLDRTSKNVAHTVYFMLFVASVAIAVKHYAILSKVEDLGDSKKQEVQKVSGGQSLWARILGKDRGYNSVAGKSPSSVPSVSPAVDSAVDSAVGTLGGPAMETSANCTASLSGLHW